MKIHMGYGHEQIKWKMMYSTYPNTKVQQFKCWKFHQNARVLKAIKATELKKKWKKIGTVSFYQKMENPKQILRKT